MGRRDRKEGKRSLRFTLAWQKCPRIQKEEGFIRTPPNRFGCDPRRHLQESSGRPGPKSKKSVKRVFLGGSADKSPKIPEKDQNANFRGSVGVLQDFFRYF